MVATAAESSMRWSGCNGRECLGQGTNAVLKKLRCGFYSIEKTGTIKHGGLGFNGLVLESFYVFCLSLLSFFQNFQSLLPIIFSLLFTFLLIIILVGHFFSETIAILHQF